MSVADGSRPYGEAAFGGPPGVGVRCASCGQEERGDAAFCGACGQALAPRVDATFVGRNCPYCRFPLKPNVEIAECPACHAVHHADCFGDNGGCAVMGCDGRLPAPPAATDSFRQQTVDVTARLPAPAARGRRPWPLVLAVCAVLAIAGSVAAVVIATSSHGSQVTVPGTDAGNPGPSSQPGSSNGSAGTTGPSSPSAAAYQGSGYSITPPAGFVQDTQDVQKDGYTESRWHLGSDPNVVFRIDRTVNPGVSSPEAAGEPVRQQVSGDSTYEELGWTSSSTSSDSAWQWTFKLNGDEKVDTFVVACGDGYAVLGGSPASEFSGYQAAFLAATQTLRP